MIAQSTVTQVKAYPDIVSIIGDYVQLRKRGRNYLGLCPFHSEKTPSFTVSEEKRLWHCFGCRESGDAISFLIKIDRLTFAEAIIHIAKKAGIDVVEDTTSVVTPEDLALEIQQKILTAAKDYFHDCLKHTPDALAYLKERGLSSESIESFELGYAPNTPQLFRFLVQKGFDLPTLKDAGLFSILQTNEWIPKLRNRIIFPILDDRGRTVGFSGRIIQQSASSAKYINSEESRLFSKRRLLYGLHKAKSAIRKEKAALITEGYMDVILAHQNGFSYTVATMGTAVTLDHARQLKRFTDRILFCLDTDDAGQTAMEKSLDITHQAGLTVSIVRLPHKDPADALLADSPTIFQSYLDAAVHPVLYLFNRLSRTLDKTNIQHVSKAIDFLAPFIRMEPDWVLQQHQVSHIAVSLGINESLLFAKINKKSYNLKTLFFNQKQSGKTKYEKAEEVLIYLSASSVELRKQLFEKLSSTDFLHSPYRELFEIIIKSEAINQDLLDTVEEAELKQTLSALLLKGIEDEDRFNPTQWVDYIHILKTYQRNTRINEIKESIKHLETTNDDLAIRRLLEELNALMMTDQP